MAMYPYFLHIAYDGTAYKGWQRQPGDVTTVQECLENTLSLILKKNVYVSGCGRTDAGVHASSFYAGIKLNTPLPDHFITAMRWQLPPDISLLDVHTVTAKANTRFDAQLRVYDYFMHQAPDPILSRYSALYDLQNMAPALCAQNLQTLCGTHDFRAFCKAPDRHNTTFVEMKSIRLFHNPDRSRYRIQFVANRFLRGMIRLLVHYAILAGEGRINQLQLAHALATGERLPSYQLAHPEGLFLTSIQYPYLANAYRLPASGETHWIEV